MCSASACAPAERSFPAVHDSQHFNTNGMSYFGKDSGFANSGIVTTVDPVDFGGEGLIGRTPSSRPGTSASRPRSPARAFTSPRSVLSDFMRNRPSGDLPATSCRSGAVPRRRRGPRATVDRHGHFEMRSASSTTRFRASFARKAIICGPEARSSSPLRILRDPETLEAPGADGFYPVGEGAGYAGGIVSAAVDGWRAAEALIGRFARADRTSGSQRHGNRWCSRGF